MRQYEILLYLRAVEETKIDPWLKKVKASMYCVNDFISIVVHVGSVITVSGSLFFFSLYCALWVTAELFI